jgi:acetylornithine deacetylase/succinyl-diaminopimelate desuccinylase-like protein
LNKHKPEGVSVEVAFEPGGAAAYALPAGHPGLALAEEILEAITATKPQRVRMGATVPIAEMFKRHLGIDTVFFSFATSDEDYHAPNEYFRLSSLEAGLRAWTRYFERLASTAIPSARSLTPRTASPAARTMA